MSTCTEALAHTCLYFTFILKIEGHDPREVLRTKPATETEMKNPSLLCFLDLFPVLVCAPGGRLLCVAFCALLASGSWVGFLHQKLSQMEALEGPAVILQALFVLSPAWQ